MPKNFARNSRVALIQANLGSFDEPREHVPQSVPYDFYYYTDENFPPRFNAMTPRLQARIPKCFGWQMAPGYDYYLWLDGSMTLAHPDAIKYFLTNCADLVALRHPRRSTVWKEIRYIQQGMDENSSYLVNRYKNELLDENLAEIWSDPDFKDDLLLNSGVFMYRNTLKVRAMLKEWWYHISRYHTVDQFAFTYCIKKSGIDFNVLEDEYDKTKYLSFKKHKKRQ